MERENPAPEARPSPDPTELTGRTVGVPSPAWHRAEAQLVEPAVGPITEPVSPGASHSVVLRRREDLLWLRIDFFDLVLREHDGEPMLARNGDAPRAVVHFPPQAVFEQAIRYVGDDDEDPSNDPPQLGPPHGAAVRSRLAGSSRLAFTVPDALLPLPYTIEALLDWTQWIPILPLAARRADGDPIPVLPSAPPGVPWPPGMPWPYRPHPLFAPRSEETSIEAPWWLQIAPNRRSGWVNATSPVGMADQHGNDRYELWHTRLATRADDASDLTEETTPERIIRAIWSPDPETAELVKNPAAANSGDPDPVPFVASLAQKDRVSLIVATTDYSFRPGYEPRPVAVNHLELSALGARLDVHGRWPKLDAFNLLEWRHRSNLGRDHYVRIVKRGCLCTKHPCILLEITERRFLDADGQIVGPVAPLIRRDLLIVTNPVIDFAGADGDRQPDGGRRLPFRSLRIHNTVTPPISKDPLLKDPLPPLPADVIAALKQCFFPTLTDGSGKDYLWHITATDWSGREHEILMPLAWMPADVAENTEHVKHARDAWNDLSQDGERGGARLNGQRVAYAEPLDPEVHSDQRDCTTATTHRMRIQLGEVVGEDGLPEDNDFFVFFPELRRAEVQLEGIEALTANDLGAIGSSRWIAYHSAYTNGEFAPGANKGGVWAQLVDEIGNPDAPSLRFSRAKNAAEKPGVGTDRAGGVLAPDLVVSGLSRTLGLAAGNLDTLTKGDANGDGFNPGDFFDENALPKLLGGVLLKDVVVPAALNGDPDDAALRIETTHKEDVTETTMRWRPRLQPDGPGIFDPGGDKTGRIDAVQRTNRGGGVSSSVVEGEIRNFDLNVPSGGGAMLVRISFHRLAFISRDGKKPDVDVLVAGAKFGGQLAWIERLSKYLNFAGDGGPEINILPDRIEALVGVPIPAITLGVFALHSISFRAGFDLPFTGDPARLRFALSSRENNFHLTVLAIGGGGYVDLAWGVDGLERLEIGFEGGAEMTVDFGPVSAGVGAMFGIQSLYDSSDVQTTVRLRGYFELYGEVDLGPISVTAELHFELGYEVRTKNGKSIKTMWGRGHLFIEIDVPLVPIPSIDITIEKNFRSDPADPTFADKMPPLPGDPQQSPAWTTYCEAFAGV